MNAMDLNVAAPGDDPAHPSAAQPSTAAPLSRLEQAIVGTLAMLRRDQFGRASDAGDIEYASWLAALRSPRP